MFISVNLSNVLWAQSLAVSFQGTCQSAKVVASGNTVLRTGTFSGQGIRSDKDTLSRREIYSDAQSSSSF